MLIAKDIYDSCINLGLSDTQAWNVVQSAIDFSRNGDTPDLSKLRKSLTGINFSTAELPSKAAIKGITDRWWQIQSSESALERLSEEAILQEIKSTIQNLELWEEYVRLIFGIYMKANDEEGV